MKPLILILFPFSIIFGQTDCEIPKPEQWENLYPNCKQVQGSYKIQFFSTRRELTKTVNFQYHIKQEDCLKRYYYGDSTLLLNYCQSLKILDEIKKDFPDAFPRLVSKFNPIKPKSLPKAVQPVSSLIKTNPMRRIFYYSQIEILKNSDSGFASNFWNQIKKGDILLLTIPYYLDDDHLYLNQPDNQTVLITIVGSGKQWKGLANTLWKYLESFPEISEESLELIKK